MTRPTGPVASLIDWRGSIPIGSRGCSGQDEQRQGQSKLSPAVVLESLATPWRLRFAPPARETPRPSRPRRERCRGGCTAQIWWWCRPPLAMVTLGVFGPTRLHLGPLDLSISSFPRLIVILLVTLTSRHLLVPKPTIVARAIDAFLRLRCSTTTRAVMPVVVSTRLAVFGGQRLRQTLCGTRCSTGRLTAVPLSPRELHRQLG